jgi:hypothetical protein
VGTCFHAKAASAAFLAFGFLAGLQPQQCQRVKIERDIHHFLLDGGDHNSYRHRDILLFVLEGCRTFFLFTVPCLPTTGLEEERCAARSQVAEQCIVSHGSIRYQDSLTLCSNHVPELGMIA